MSQSVSLGISPAIIAAQAEASYSVLKQSIRASLNELRSDRIRKTNSKLFWFKLDLIEGSLRCAAKYAAQGKGGAV